MALAAATSGKEGDLVLRDLKGKGFKKLQYHSATNTESSYRTI
jgi:hypothetical protein